MIKVGNGAEIDHHPKHQTVNTYHGVQNFWACVQRNEEKKWEYANIFAD
jgi:hypothetical protein